MIDYARITVKSGSGGQGAGSFFHLKGKRYGKADGGDGGNGGNVFLEATFDLNTLEPFRYIKDYKSGNGGNGLSNHRKGAVGEELVIKVPVGTTVKVTVGQRDKVRKYIERADKNEFTYDLTQVGQRVLVARGGQGGRGNAKLRDELGRRPRAGETGEQGEDVNLTLELKLIADVGLIGLPNAGKSTLLAALTKATPKIADYPFTTLEPNLGVLKVENGKWKVENYEEKLSTFNSQLSIVIADIPGLIEGASQGKGLGDLFLRHIERTKVLVHLVDIASSVQGLASSEEIGRNFWNDYQTVRNELKAYSKELAKKREIIALNKIDQTDPQAVQTVIGEFAGHRKKVTPISAKNGTGLDDLVNLILKVTEKT